MKSVNFEILRPRWPETAELGGFAEAYVHSDPASALIELHLSQILLLTRASRADGP